MSVIRKLLTQIWNKGFIHIVAGNFMTKVVTFLGTIFLVRLLSKQEYGALGYIENLYNYFVVIAGAGMSNAILRYVILGKNKEDKYSNFCYAFFTGFVWNVILVFVAQFIVKVYPHVENYQSYTGLFNILIWALPFQYITDNVLCNERAMLENKRYALMAFLLSFSFIALRILAVVNKGIRGGVFCCVLLYFVAAIIMVIMTYSKHYIGTRPYYISNEKKKEVSLYAFQYMITNGLWTIFMLNDTFILGRFWGPEVIADYNVAYTIPACLNIISMSLGLFVAPYFIQNEKNIEWIRKNFKKVYFANVAFIGGIALLIGILAKNIIIIFYGEQYLSAHKIMIILLIASFCNCGLRYCTANILSSMGQVKYNMLISSLGMFLQIAINIMVVPRFGAVGVAITSCFVHIFMAVALLVIFIKKYYM